MFQNVKNLEKYINIIKEDRGFKAADVLIFVQTSSLDSDKLLLDNYSLINFSSSNNENVKIEHTVYIKRNILKNNIIHLFHSENYKNIIQVNGFTIDSTAIIFFYNSSDAPFEKIVQMMDVAFETAKDRNSSKIIFMGSCNIDLKDKENENSIKIQELFLQYKTAQATMENHSSTTDNKQTDFCFSCSIEAHYYETIFSTHKAIWFEIDNEKTDDEIPNMLKSLSITTKNDENIDRSFKNLYLNEFF